MYRFTFSDAVQEPRKLQPLGLVFDGEGIEIRKYQEEGSFKFQTFCVCGAHQLTPGSRSAANRWRKQHQRNNVCGQQKEKST